MPECQRCGRCCKELYGSFGATMHDKNRWDDVVVTTNRGKMYLLDEMICPVCFDIFVNPETDDLFLNCPFLRKVRGKDIYECLIHDIKPDVCRDYHTDSKIQCVGQVSRTFNDELLLALVGPTK